MAGATLALTASGAPARPLPAAIGRSPGYWRLDNLSRRPSTRLTQRRPTTRIPISLPPGARQGPRLWYIARVHVGAEFSVRPGLYQVSASVNGRAMAQFTFAVDRRRVLTQSLGMITGRRVVTTPGHTVDGILENYLQIAAVRPGRGVLSFSLETFRGPPPRKVVVLSDSGLGATLARPDELQLATAARSVRVHVGDRFAIPFRITRRGARPDGPISVGADVATGSQGPVVLAGPGSRSFGSVEDGRSGAFQFKATAPAIRRVVLGVPNRYNEPHASVVVTILPKGRRSLNAPALFAAAGAVVLFSLSRIRRKREER